MRRCQRLAVRVGRHRTRPTSHTPRGWSHRIEVHGGSGVRIIGCHLEDLREDPYPIPSNGDIFNQADSVQSALGTFLESGMPHEIEVTAGAYRLVFVGPDDDQAETITVSVVQLDETRSLRASVLQDRSP